MNKIYWYELCFFGDEDPDSEEYDANKACSFVIKTEIPPTISDDIALMWTTRINVKSMS